MPIADYYFALPEVQDRIHKRAARTAKPPLFTSSDIDDVLQELSAHLFERLKRYVPGRGDLLGFVYRVLKNKAVNLIRKRRRDGLGVAVEGLDTADPEPCEDRRRPGGADDAVALSFDIATVRAGLDPDDAALFDAVCAGLSVADIAAKNGKPRTTVHGQWERLRARLRVGPLGNYFDSRRRMEGPQV